MCASTTSCKPLPPMALPPHPTFPLPHMPCDVFALRNTQCAMYGRPPAAAAAAPFSLTASSSINGRRAAAISYHDGWRLGVKWQPAGGQADAGRPPGSPPVTGRAPGFALERRVAAAAPTSSRNQQLHSRRGWSGAALRLQDWLSSGRANSSLPS